MGFGDPRPNTLRGQGTDPFSFQRPKHLRHTQPAGLLVLRGLLPKSVGEDRPHKTSPREKRGLASKTVMVLTAERSLFTEARQECKGMHACFGFPCPEFTVAPLQAPDTCQTAVPRRWDCKPLRVQKSHSFGRESADLTEE